MTVSAENYLLKVVTERLHARWLELRGENCTIKLQFCICSPSHTLNQPTKPTNRSICIHQTTALKPPLKEDLLFPANPWPSEYMWLRLRARKYPPLSIRATDARNKTANQKQFGC